MVETSWIFIKDGILEKGGVDLEKGGGYDPPYQLYLNYIIDPTFTKVNILFVLSFENEDGRIKTILEIFKEMKDQQCYLSL